MRKELPALASLVLLLGLLVPSAGAQTLETRRFALVIGVNQYADPTILRLQKAQRDAIDLAAALNGSGSYKSVKLMTDNLPWVDPLFPSRDNVIAQVEQLAGLLRPEDQVLLFFSGHGMNDAASGDSYLLTIDAKARNAAGTALNLQRDVLAVLESAGVRNVVALVDACQKNLTADKGLTVVGVDRVKPAGQAVVISATSPGKASYEDPKGNNGLFTAGLLAAFSGAADLDGNGELSVAELERYLPDAVAERAFNANLNQKPTVWDAGAGARQPSLGKAGRSVALPPPSASPSSAQAANATRPYRFREDFSDNFNQWPARDDQDAAYGIQDGAFVFAQKRAGWWNVCKTIPLDPASDFRIEATFTKVKGNNGSGYGLLWGRGSDNRLYYFMVAGTGRFVYGRHVGTAWQDVIGWTANPAVSPLDTTNKLAVRRHGQSLDFLVNGQVVGTAPFEGFFGDDIGFILTGPNKVEIRDFVIE